jgi:hypothetical protein
MKCFKIVDNHNGILKTLFHGVNGSRVLKTNEWLKADIKDVRDGSCQTYYKSGWHVLSTYEECAEYLKRFTYTDNRKIVECKAKNVWPKTHSIANVYLAEYILIKG